MTGRKPKNPRKNVPVVAERLPRVKSSYRPQTERTPRRENRFHPPDPTGKIVIQFGQCDVGSAWCLTKITPEDHATLLGRIRSIETMRITEAFNAGDEPGKDYDLTTSQTGPPSTGSSSCSTTTRTGSADCGSPARDASTASGETSGSTCSGGILSTRSTPARRSTPEETGPLGAW